jgi:diadenosine tetraphosphate (Ap4A) HIT family hydrolase
MGASERLYHSQGRECGLGGLPGKRSRDAFPVTPYHTLIIPKRHVLDYFGLKQPEINAINRLLTDQKAALQKADLTIDGFNVGMNCGETAGLIPRRRGDLARQYLSDPDLSISRIAWLLGYQEVSAFTHAFKRRTGKTPREAHARQTPRSNAVNLIAASK